MSDYRLSDDLTGELARLRAGARAVRALKSDAKNAALVALAEELERRSEAILAANRVDLEKLPADTTPAFRDRLTLNPARLAAMAESLRQVAALADPVGEVVEQRELHNGLKIRRERAPLGTILFIFESRPNVILEAFSLAFKSGNVVCLRGGSESSATANVIYDLMNDVLPVKSSFIGLRDYDRRIVEHLLKRKDVFDVVVPRGGDRLIAYVQETALMPIIKNDRGLCHTYIHEDADLEMAVRIVVNAKVQRPGVCNSLETVLVHESVAEKFLPMLYAATEDVALAWHADARAERILTGRARVRAATPADWDTEYLDLIMNAAVVASFDEALAHIERHGSRHSEAIVTNNPTLARTFQAEVDAAAVYWNASTRFTDGFEFGLGGELGVSTQKIHVRGPLGLRELTTPRWIIDGNGQIRA